MELRAVTIQLDMLGLMVKDMSAALAFYRRLGLDIPDDADDKRFVMYRMPSGVTLFWDAFFAKTYDPEFDSTYTAPPGGYKSMFEFFLGSPEAVTAKYEELVGFGYHGRCAPVQTDGPFAAMVDDPDGNVVLLTGEPLQTAS
jgi:catechol 2,3-dioxygenase-like lactoylglutathione lyase family enzyme